MMKVIAILVLLLPAAAFAQSADNKGANGIIWMESGDSAAATSKQPPTTPGKQRIIWMETGEGSAAKSPKDPKGYTATDDLWD